MAYALGLVSVSGAAERWVRESSTASAPFQQGHTLLRSAFGLSGDPMACTPESLFKRGNCKICCRMAERFPRRRYLEVGWGAIDFYQVKRKKDGPHG